MDRTNLSQGEFGCHCLDKSNFEISKMEAPFLLARLVVTGWGCRFSFLPISCPVPDE